MSTRKTKIPRLSEQQYNEYVATLKNDPALYNADGTLFVPDQNFDTSEDDAWTPHDDVY
ncbi:MAG: hypothetical protein ACI4VK_00095 [Candidatus Coproplasma sp.]